MTYRLASYKSASIVLCHLYHGYSVMESYSIILCSPTATRLCL